MKLKLLSALLSFAAVCLLLNAAEEQWTGEAAVRAGRGGRVERASRTTQPVEFRNLMTYQWIFAGMVAGAAVFMWRVMRRQDSLDILAPDREEKGSRETV